MNFQVSYILFADAKGYSKLTELQLQLFCREIVPKVCHCFNAHQSFHCNTWGDGFVAAFRDCVHAVDAALEVRDLFRNTRWSDLGLPDDLAVRIAIHGGRIATYMDTLSGKEHIVGREVSHAARIEPVVFPNEVFATRSVIQALESIPGKKTVVGEEIGEYSLAKNWGSEELYRLRRPSEAALTNLREQLPEILNVFRVLEENEDRNARMKKILSRPSGTFDLSAFSGFSYLHEEGQNWTGGVRRHLKEGKRMRVVLMHPNSSEAQFRRHAERRPPATPFLKVPLKRLEELVTTYPTLDIRLSRAPLYCSLFFVDGSVLYDPYHLGCAPDRENSQNQFLVIEFSRGKCYDLLKLHFEFLWDKAEPLAEVAGQYLNELGN